MFLFFLTEKNPNFLLIKKNGGYPGELNQHDHNIICLTIVNSGKKLKFKFFLVYYNRLRLLLTGHITYPYVAFSSITKSIKMSGIKKLITT